MSRVVSWPPPAGIWAIRVIISVTDVSEPNVRSGAAMSTVDSSLLDVPRMRRLEDR